MWYSFDSLRIWWQKQEYNIVIRSHLNVNLDHRLDWTEMIFNSPFKCLCLQNTARNLIENFNTQFEMRRNYGYGLHQRAQSSKTIRIDIFDRPCLRLEIDYYYYSTSHYVAIFYSKMNLFLACISIAIHLPDQYCQRCSLFTGEKSHCLIFYAMQCKNDHTNRYKIKFKSNLVINGRFITEIMSDD